MPSRQQRVLPEPAQFFLCFRWHRKRLFRLVIESFLLGREMVDLLIVRCRILGLSWPRPSRSLIDSDSWRFQLVLRLIVGWHEASFRWRHCAVQCPALD